MKLIILKQNLKEALSVVERGVIENNNLPILKNISLKTNSQLILSSTNLEIGITHTTPAKILTGGSVTVPFAPLFNIISAADSERIQLETDKQLLIVKTDNYEARLQGISEEDFPIIPKIENQAQYLEIKDETLKAALEQIISAAHISEIKPELSGVLFDFQVGVLKLVATDSFRLAEKSILSSEFSTTINKGVKAIIPLNTVQEVLRAFNSGERIQIFLDPHQILFKSKQTSIISRLIDGEYPDYQPIIPKEAEIEVLIDREKLLTALKLTSTFASRLSDVRIKSEAKAKTIELYSKNQAVGENTYLIPVKKQKGDKLAEISFNWRYLLDGIRPMPTKQIILGLTSESRPAVIKPLDDESLVYIVMPTKAG